MGVAAGLEQLVIEKGHISDRDVPRPALLRAIEGFCEGPFSDDRPREYTHTVAGADSQTVALPAALAVAIRRKGAVGAVIRDLEISPFDAEYPNFVRLGDWYLSPMYSSAPDSIVIRTQSLATSDTLRIYVRGTRYARLPYPTAVSVAATGLQDGATYYFRVAALDDHGESEASASTASIRGAGVFSDDDYLTVSWFNDGAAIGYKVYISDDTTTWTALTTTAATATSYQITSNPILTGTDTLLTDATATAWGTFPYSWRSWVAAGAARACLRLKAAALSDKSPPGGGQGDAIDWTVFGRTAKDDMKMLETEYKEGLAVTLEKQVDGGAPIVSRSMWRPSSYGRPIFEVNGPPRRYR